MQKGGEALSSIIQRQLTSGHMIKKPLNIPIGDVTLDGDYNKDVPASFRLPSNYVKHIKKIGDEVDVSFDYIIDDDDEVWIKGLGSLGIPKDMQKLMSSDAFETIINILERYTGLSKDPIPQANAFKVIQEELLWPDAASAKLLPLAYSYWLSKRMHLGKPLCRKYWPQITSSDTNPRQVFRARDKERYKLRKQQKRNDIDAFRKMQQLRKEFTTARNLMHLILERELLREAEFDSQREVFEVRARELGIEYTPPEAQGGTGAEEALQGPPRHTLRFEDLVYPPQERMLREAEEKAAELAKLGGSDGMVGVVEPISAMGKKINDKKRKRDRDRELQQSAGESSEPPMIVYTYDANNNIIPNPPAPTAAPARSSSGRNTSRGGGGGGARASNSGIAAATFDPTLTNAEIYAALVAENQLLDEPIVPAVELRVIPPAVEGPPVICQPAWPSFMEAKPNFEQRMSAADYLTDLEYRVDERNGNYLEPARYKARCRIGRGGRLVLDRVPVYDDDDELDENDCNTSPAQDAVHIYPTSLTYQYPENAFALLFPPVAINSTTAASTSTNATVSTTAARLGTGDSSVGAHTNSSNLNGNASVGPTQVLPEIPLSNARFYFSALKARAINAAQVLSQAASPIPEISSYNTNITAQQRNRLSRLPKMPPFAPSSGGGRVVIPPHKAARLAAILAASDSEDERAIIPKYRRGEDFERNVSIKPAAGEPIKPKYATRLR